MGFHDFPKILGKSRCVSRPPRWVLCRPSHIHPGMGAHTCRYWGRLVETTTISENGKQVPAWVLKLETMAEDIKSAAAARGQRHGVLSGGDEHVEMLKNRLAR